MKKPNIVLINCDDMGYGDLSCYGSKINDTPFIDSLAKSGVKMTNCYAASPVCSPSRASLMTGCYPATVNINRVLFPGEPFGLNEKEYTLGNLFKDGGYNTMIVGKWHLGDQKEFLPCNFGFDEYYGLPYSNDMGMQLGRTDFTKFPPLPLISNDEVIQEQPDQTALTERYVEKSVEFIRKNKNNPFFLYFPQMHVHLPLYANSRFYKDTRNGDFGASVAEVDWSCHVIVDELKRQGVYENTLIIFTSDNGSRAALGASNGELRGKKFFTWEGGMRVPCIFHWKGMLDEGVVNDDISSHIDFMPLFAHIIGEKAPENIDGVDIYNSVFKGEKVRDEFIYLGYNFDDEDLPYFCAVRKNNWKLHLQIRKEEGGYENCQMLFDLDEDIGEANNLYDEKPEIVKELTELASKYIKIYGDQTSNTVGINVRKCGLVDKPVTLTTYDENHPYIIAMYDKDENG